MVVFMRRRIRIKKPVKKFWSAGFKRTMTVKKTVKKKKKQQ